MSFDRYEEGWTQGYWMGQKDLAAMTQRDQTISQAHDYVTAAEALADAVREYLAGMGGQAQLSDALDAFYQAKHTASRSLSESGASRAGTASGSDQAAADMGSDG